MQVLPILELVYKSFKSHMPVATTCAIYVQKFLSGKTSDKNSEPHKEQSIKGNIEKILREPWVSKYAELMIDLLSLIWQFGAHSLIEQSSTTVQFLQVHQQLYRLLAAHRPIPKLKLAKGIHTSQAVDHWYKEQKELSDLYYKDLAFNPGSPDSWLVLFVHCMYVCYHGIYGWLGMWFWCQVSVGRLLETATFFQIGRGATHFGSCQS